MVQQSAERSLVQLRVEALAQGLTLDGIESLLEMAARPASMFFTMFERSSDDAENMLVDGSSADQHFDIVAPAGADTVITRVNLSFIGAMEDVNGFLSGAVLAADSGMLIRWTESDGTVLFDFLDGNEITAHRQVRASPSDAGWRTAPVHHPF